MFPIYYCGSRCYEYMRDGVGIINNVPFPLLTHPHFPLSFPLEKTHSLLLPLPFPSTSNTELTIPRNQYKNQTRNRPRHRRKKRTTPPRPSHLYSRTNPTPTSPAHPCSPFSYYSPSPPWPIEPGEIISDGWARRRVEHCDLHG